MRALKIINNFYNGISTQEPSLRLDNQLESQVNYDSNLKYGCSSREGFDLMYNKTISDVGEDSNSFRPFLTDDNVVIKFKQDKTISAKPLNDVEVRIKNDFLEHYDNYDINNIRKVEVQNNSLFFLENYSELGFNFTSNAQLGLIKQYPAWIKIRDIVPSFYYNTAIVIFENNMPFTAAFATVRATNSNTVFEIARKIFDSIATGNGLIDFRNQIASLGLTLSGFLDQNSFCFYLMQPDNVLDKYHLKLYITVDERPMSNADLNMLVYGLSSNDKFAYNGAFLVNEVYVKGRRSRKMQSEAGGATIKNYAVAINDNTVAREEDLPSMNRAANMFIKNSDGQPIPYTMSNVTLKPEYRCFKQGLPTAYKGRIYIGTMPDNVKAYMLKKNYKLFAISDQDVLDAHGDVLIPKDPLSAAALEMDEYGRVYFKKPNLGTNTMQWEDHFGADVEEFPTLGNLIFFQGTEPFYAEPILKWLCFKIDSNPLDNKDQYYLTYDNEISSFVETSDNPDLDNYYFKKLPGVLGLVKSLSVNPENPNEYAIVYDFNPYVMSKKLSGDSINNNIEDNKVLKNFFQANERSVILYGDKIYLSAKDNSLMFTRKTMINALDSDAYSIDVKKISGSDSVYLAPSGNGLLLITSKSIMYIDYDGNIQFKHDVNDLIHRAFILEFGPESLICINDDRFYSLIRNQYNTISITEDVSFHKKRISCDKLPKIISNNNKCLFIDHSTNRLSCISNLRTSQASIVPYYELETQGILKHLDSNKTKDALFIADEDDKVYVLSLANNGTQLDFNAQVNTLEALNELPNLSDVYLIESKTLKKVPVSDFVEGVDYTYAWIVKTSITLSPAYPNNIGESKSYAFQSPLKLIRGTLRAVCKEGYRITILRDANTSPQTSSIFITNTQKPQGFDSFDSNSINDYKFGIMAEGRNCYITIECESFEKNHLLSMAYDVQLTNMRRII